MSKMLPDSDINSQMLSTCKLLPEAKCVKEYKVKDRPSTRRNGTKVTRRRILTVISVGSVLAGLFVTLYNRSIFDQILNSQMVIKTGTETFKAWKETPIPAYTKFYFFDVLNAKEFVENGTKLSLKERGPYTFRQTERKVDISWNPDNTVTYGREKYWFFEPSLSSGSLNDAVTTINMPMVGAAEFARGDYFTQFGISDLLATIQAELFITKTVGQLMFEGYEDPLLQMQTAFMEDDDGSEEEEDWLRDFNRRRKREIPTMEKFGWFYQRNGSSWADGRITMATGEGEGGIQHLGKIISWEGEKTTQAFTGHCAKVQGSADGLFPPGIVNEKNSLEMYATDICRTLKFERQSSSTLMDIPVEKFVLSPTVFANSSVEPANACYSNNLPSGVQNVTQCKVKSPAFVSRPHFYLADPFYQAQFLGGISPSVESHESFLLLEPQTSIPLKVQMRLQINILVDRIPGIQYVFSNLTRTMLPVIWFDSQFAMTEEVASSIHILLNLPTIFQASGLLVVTFGFASLFIIYLSTVRRKKENEEGIKVTSLEKPILKVGI